MRVHITVMTVGTHGDVRPFVALGRGLRSEGHAVRIATHDVHAGFVERHGLEFASLEGNPRALLESHLGQAWLRSGNNPVTFWRRLRTLVRENVEKGLADAVQACRGTDAVIHTFFGAAGYHVAQKMGIPHLMATLQPFARTRAFPCGGFPALPFGGAYNLLTYRIAEEAAWQMGRRWVNSFREDVLGMEPLPRWGALSRLYAESETVLCGFSEHVVPRPGDWPGNHEIAGFWFMDDSAWSPPDDFLDFTGAGPAPIVIGFGSLGGSIARRLYEVAVEALSLTRQRAVLLGGWADAGDLALPEKVYGIESAPHGWLFPRVAAVVHHGGAGTTAAAIRAGVASVVIPLFADQPFWGQRVHALGVGPPPLRARRLSARLLADAIKLAVSDGGMRCRAARLAEKVQAEDGISRAVQCALRTFGG